MKNEFLFSYVINDDAYYADHTNIQTIFFNRILVIKQKLLQRRNQVVFSS